MKRTSRKNYSEPFIYTPYRCHYTPYGDYLGQNKKPFTRNEWNSIIAIGNLADCALFAVPDTGDGDGDTFTYTLETGIGLSSWIKRVRFWKMGDENATQQLDKTMVWDVIAKLRYVSKSERKIVLSMILDWLAIENQTEQHNYLITIDKQLNNSLSGNTTINKHHQDRTLGNTFDLEDLEVINAVMDQYPVNVVYSNNRAIYTSGLAA